jgi:hypothetical protein
MKELWHKPSEAQLVALRALSSPQRREQSRQHVLRINRDPEVRARQVAGKRKTAEVGAPKADPNAEFLQRLAEEARSELKP